MYYKITIPEYGYEEGEIVEDYSDDPVDAAVEFASKAFQDYDLWEIGQESWPVDFHVQEWNYKDETPLNNNITVVSVGLEYEPSFYRYRSKETTVEELEKQRAEEEARRKANQPKPIPYREFSEKEWNDFGELLYGKDRKDWKFICPTCRTVYSANSIDPENKLNEWAPYSECPGRYKGGVGCDWCAYGLFSGPWAIKRDDGVTYVFPFADMVPK